MMTLSVRAALFCALITAIGHAQTITVPLTPSAWIASDSIRAETHLGRPSIYIDRGAAIIGDADFRDGTIELDMAATARTNFMGIGFHATTTDNSEVVFFRVERERNVGGGAIRARTERSWRGVAGVSRRWCERRGNAGARAMDSREDRGRRLRRENLSRTIRRPR